MSEKTVIPEHVGLIMDGNRRWARAHNVPTLQGHARGQEVLRDIVGHSFEQGVKFVSAYAFSTENWRRTEDEVGYLMSLVRRGLDKYIGELDKQGIKIIFLGERAQVDKKVVQAIEQAEAKTAHNTKGTLAICFNYGGQQEIVNAVRHLVANGYGGEAITADLISRYLYYPELPPIDMIIRTSGEQRISNFMLWRAAYSELYFTEKYWPDFTAEDFDEALKEYEARGRRFGG